MAGEGAPISYEVLEADTPVRSSDGVIVGKVQRVLADLEADIFDGLEIHTTVGSRFVEAEQVASIHEHGVDLRLDAAAVADLPEPDKIAPSYHVDPAAEAGSLTQVLGRIAERLGGGKGWRRS